MGLEKSSSLDPLIQATEGKSPPRTFSFKGRFGSSWRVTVSTGAVLAAAALIINVTILAWGTSSMQTDGRSAKLYEGSCENTQKTTLWVHLAINVLSTLLLGASNNCAQLLSSPTRSEIDKAHSRGIWLEIGVPGVRNLRYIERRRRLIWVLLPASSLPLHLLYNSAIYSTFAANRYQVALVTNEFVSGGWWDEARVASTIGFNDLEHYYGGLMSDFYAKAVDPTRVMQNNIDRLVRLENKECLQTYTTKFQSMWGDVLVVTSVERNSSAIQVWNHDPGFNNVMDPAFNDQAWVCSGREADRSTLTRCDYHSLLSNPNNWTIHHAAQCRRPERGSCRSFDAPIEYCLATKTPSHCSLRMSPTILSVVIVSNLVKVGCLLSTVFLRNFEPVATSGDAVSSFIQSADPVTSTTGFISGKAEVNICESDSRRWGSAVGGCRILLCIGVCFAFWSIGLILFFAGFTTLESKLSGYRLPSWTEISKDGFGAMHLSYTIGKKSHHSFMQNVLLANMPQLGLSVVCVLYNNVFTYMVAAHESTKFASTRKPLRVSRPAGKQRTTFWLQLPYRYAVPLLSSMAVLHWMLSRSLFMFQLTVFADNGTKVVDKKDWNRLLSFKGSHRSVLACGYSPLAIVYALIFGACLIFALTGLLFRKLNRGMPITASNSLAISAAASTASIEPNAAQLPLKYGALPSNWSRRQIQRIGFSSKEVEPIIYCEYEVIGRCVRLDDREYWVT